MIIIHLGISVASSSSLLGSAQGLGDDWLVAKVLEIALTEFLAGVTVGLGAVLLDSVYGRERGHAARPVNIHAGLQCKNQATQVRIAGPDRVHHLPRFGGRYRGHLVLGHDHRAVLAP